MTRWIAVAFTAIILASIAASSERQAVRTFRNAQQRTRSREQLQ